MKRAGGLIPQIACFDNLHLAFFKAKKGKEHKEAVIDYRKNLAGNLSRLQQQILSGMVNVGNYHYFTIYDPKERQICAADGILNLMSANILTALHILFFKKCCAFASKILCCLVFSTK
jgi:hypothetical protein